MYFRFLCSHNKVLESDIIMVYMIVSVLIFIFHLQELYIYFY